MDLHCLLLLSFFLLKDCGISNRIITTVSSSLFRRIHWLSILMLYVHDLVWICAAASFTLWSFHTGCILLLEFPDLIIMPIFQWMLYVSLAWFLLTLQSFIMILIIVNWINIVFELIELVRCTSIWLLWHISSYFLYLELFMLFNYNYENIFSLFLNFYNRVYEEIFKNYY